MRGKYQSTIMVCCVLIWTKKYEQRNQTRGLSYFWDRQHREASEEGLSTRLCLHPLHNSSNMTKSHRYSWVQIIMLTKYSQVHIDVWLFWLVPKAWNANCLRDITQFLYALLMIEHFVIMCLWGKFISNLEQLGLYSASDWILSTWKSVGARVFNSSRECSAVSCRF